MNHRNFDYSFLKSRDALNHKIQNKHQYEVLLKIWRQFQATIFHEDQTKMYPQVYQNLNGYPYLCLEASEERPYRATMQQPKSRWTFTAVNCRMYDDGKINWDYSIGGFFAEKA